MLSFLYTLLSLHVLVGSLLIIPAQLLGIKLYKFKGRTADSFLSKVKYAAVWHGDEPESWIFGTNFIGLVSFQEIPGSYTFVKITHIICTQSTYQQYMHANNKITERVITYHDLEENNYGLVTYVRYIPVPTKTIKPHQLNVVNDIINLYQQQNHVVCLIHGAPGTMKSMTSQFLCKELLRIYNDVILVNNYDPSLPGMAFSALYSKVSPSKYKPFVLVLEEIDIIVDAINKVKKNKYSTKAKVDIFPSIRDKRTWNHFFDKIGEGFINNIIIVMNTNKSLDFFNDLDESYIRNGRIDLKYGYDMSMI